MENEILALADKIINGERQDQYGKAEDNFAAIGVVWAVLLRNKLKDGEHIDARTTALLLAGMKVVRESNAPKLDNWVDLAGYAGLGGKICLQEMLEGEKVATTAVVQVVKKQSFFKKVLKFFGLPIACLLIFVSSVWAEGPGVVFIKVVDAHGYTAPGLAMIYPFPIPPGSDAADYIKVTFDPRYPAQTVVIQLEDVGDVCLPDTYDKAAALERFRTWNAPASSTTKNK